MSEISQEMIEKALHTTADTVIRNEKYFSNLDGLAGDGDFGTSLASGFKAMEREWDEIDKSSIGSMMLKISMICSKHVGGSSGPIWGTGFMKAAMPTRDKTSITLGEAASLLQSAIDGIMARGGAKRGDKTLLDALFPVQEAMAAHAGSGDLGAALKDAAAAADAAVDDTRSLRAGRGRASQVGERSKDTPDPGIVAIATILHDWCKAFGVESAPNAAEVQQAIA
jgi:dihydroxyacetone kinase phosphoprotein-dependent L subunit